MKKIYFNRCFTTTSQLIEQLKNNTEKECYDIIMSYTNSNKYLESCCSHFEVEPKVKDREYVEYILNNLRTHKPDFFLPRYNVNLLLEYKDEIEAIGVKTMFVGTPDTYRLIDNKVELYNDIAETGIISIPETYVVSNFEEFKKGYENIRTNGWRGCYKPIKGIGGEGFKIIHDHINMNGELFLSSATAITKERIEHCLGRVESVEPFMLSGFMEGQEYSIDCLAKDGEILLAIPRRKIDKYTQLLEYNSELIDVARKITKHYNLSYLFNIQVKYHNGVPYLIEINMRTSGGLYKTNGTGANMLYQAIRLLENKKPTITMEELDWNIILQNDLSFSVRPYNK